MIRQILLFLSFCILISSTSFATVVPGYQHDTNLSLSYPLIYTSNQQAQNQINSDIASYVEKAKSSYYGGYSYSEKLKYSIPYEDDSVISVILMRFTYMGGAHSIDHCYGLVYDKMTGNKIPLSHFLKIDNVAQLNNAISTGFFPMYNSNNKIISAWGKVKRISPDYYLKGNGKLYLIYQPYELASYANGFVSIEFTPKTIDYFNRLKNRTLW